MRKQLDRIRIRNGFCSIVCVTSKESEPKHLHHALFRGATIIKELSRIERSIRNDSSCN